MPRRPRPVLSPRKTPQQARSSRLVEAILQAAVRVLERDGAAAFTTVRVAERAGVSVGSLYQYFPNKNYNTHHSAPSSPGRIDGCLATRFHHQLRSIPGKTAGFGKALAKGLGLHWRMVRLGGEPRGSPTTCGRPRTRGGATPRCHNLAGVVRQREDSQRVASDPGREPVRDDEPGRPAAKPRQSRSQVEPTEPTTPTAKPTTPAARPKRQGRSQVEVEPIQSDRWFTPDDVVPSPSPDHRPDR
ncbi:helix-turn-helix domain containing protein [Nannocystis poenicansa]|uniref:Helix-turn-helix domain containing protein n=1 Tax=Nannocystis punicea TaxID=2995304 RepID=A0ABY7HJU3_9BACT|nr:helix-turn-helix domain containing protein [Nannocystis poenicansa]